MDVKQKILSKELRFKDEFGNNYPDWEEKKLGDIGEFKTSSVDKLINEGEKMISLVNYMNVYNHQNITNENTKNLMQVSAKEKQIETSNLKRGDILFTPSSETPSDIGYSIVIFEDLNNTLYSYHLMRFRPIITLDILYSHYFCNIPSVLKQITRFATGSTRFTISVGSFSKVIIQLPSLEEQKKIANFFSSVDKKLQQLTKKKDLLEEYKKGLMQKIFSQELRFKDELGNNYPDWENKKLGEVCDVKVGGTPSTTKKEYWDGDIGWISSGGLNNGNVTQPSKLITKLGLDNSSAKMMPENTVMLAMTGATLGRIGYLKFNSSANQSVAGFLPNETYNSKYLFYTLQHGVNQVFKYSGGAAQQGINKQSILNLKYEFPSIDEQHKIANFLSSIDKKIDLVNTQIEKTKVFKKGLLQQMFV